MTSGNVMTQVRKGMEVKTTDGVSLGTIAHIWFGIDPASGDQPCDEEECSRLEVHLPHRRGIRYVPYNAIASVFGNTVNLNVTEAVANDRLWHERPSWLPAEMLNEDIDHLRRPHPEQDYS